MDAKASRTAEQVALFRSLETVRPEPRLFRDPYARAALGPGYRLVATLARLPQVGRWLQRYLDRNWPAGPRASAIVRTRLIDDLVDQAVAGGAEQVILLGAGYDSRAFRLPSLKPLTVFEVDHPATQAVKQRVVRRIPDRNHVRFVPADLMTTELTTVLDAAGLKSRPTVVVWEGVTNYLDADSVDRTLTGLAAVLAPSSRIVFTYVDRMALDGSGDFPGYAEWAASVRSAGEPFTFGFVPAELAGYLADRGLRLTADVSAREAAERYLEPLGRYEPAAPFYRIAQAEVV